MAGDLASYVERGLLTERRHPRLPLRIFNYTPRVQFEGLWDEVTTACRGLVLDDSGAVIARPFPKFWNLNDRSRPECCDGALPADPPEITEKLDGSLGILVRYDGAAIIATRGSFESEQAAWATDWLSRHLPDVRWPDGVTPLFEILSPVSQIVVRYPEDEFGLVLLGFVDNATGEEWAHARLAEWAWSEAHGSALRLVTVLDGGDIRELAHHERGNFEGYVAAWKRPGGPPFRVKVKLAEYVRLHRILTAVSPVAIWEALASQQPLDALYERTPDEFREWLTGWTVKLSSEAEALIDAAEAAAVIAAHECSNRKDVAEFLRERHADVIDLAFLAYDGKLDRLREKAWKRVRPSGRDAGTFRKDAA